MAAGSVVGVAYRRHMPVIPPAAAPSVVGVLPAAAATRRKRLLEALAKVIPVRFEGRDSHDVDGLDGVVVFADEGPCIEESALSPAVPSLVFTCVRHARPHRGTTVTLAPVARIDSRLRARTFDDADAASCIPLQPEPGDEILASSSGAPVWIVRPSVGARSYLSSVPPSELLDGERIRGRFRPGQFISLLPLVHFLREVTKTTSWTPPPLRAAFIIDDPNLHWPSYGYVDFLDLARHAHAHRYHTSMAIIPLDLWYFDRRAVRIFRESAAELSLVIHGNDHVRAELAQPRPEREALGLVAQALCRVSRFERRTGLQIDRVMVPPHGDCNDTMFDALARAGFDALSWSPKPSSAISGWEVADVSPGGLPSIPRTLLGDRDDVPFRAYLDQPIVLEGHHTDLADGLDLLQEAAGDVNGLGSVTWSSPGGIARTNYASRRLGNQLQIRMFSRRIELTIPDGVERIAVTAPAYQLQHDETVTVRSLGGVPPTSAALSEDLTVSPGRTEIRLVRSRTLGEQTRPRPAQPWPYLRRALTEGRDRALPLTRTVRSRAGG